MIEQEKWEVKACTESEFSQVEDFFKQQFQGGGSYGSQDLFKWKLLDNYVQPGVFNAVKDSKTIVSTTSLTPKNLFINEECVRAAEIGDTYTDKQYQRRGLFALLVNQTVKDGFNKEIQFIYGTPNNQSLPAYEKRTKFRQLSGIELRSLSYFFDISSYLERKVPKVLAKPIYSVYKVLALLNLHARSKFSGNKYRLMESKVLPASWEGFWNKCKAQHSWILDRSRKAMDWRYLQNPCEYKFIFAYEGQVLCGYLCYTILVEESGCTLVIADFLCLKGRSEALGKALSHLLISHVNTKVFKALLWCPEKHFCYSVFKKYGFYSRSRVPVIGIASKGSQLQGQQEDWHFTIGDSDNI